MANHKVSAVPERTSSNIAVVEITEGEMIWAVSNLHLKAFSGFLNSRFGKGYASALIRWFAREKEAIAIAAIDRNCRAIGYAIGCPSHVGHRLRRDIFWATVRSLALRPWLLFDSRLWEAGMARFRDRLNHKASPSSELPQPIMSLFGIGVDLDYRKKGVGLRLLKAFEETARKQGMRSLLLCVHEDGIATRRLYEKCGWTPRPSEDTGVVQYVRLLQ